MVRKIFFRGDKLIEHDKLIEKIKSLFNKDHLPHTDSELDNEYRLDDLEFIWGCKSGDCLVDCEPNLYTMNDIDIIFNYSKGKYTLGIETAYVFENSDAECRYLLELIMKFERFMEENYLSKNYRLCLFSASPEGILDMKADTVEELYAKFNIFVEGYLKHHNFNG